MIADHPVAERLQAGDVVIRRLDADLSRLPPVADGRRQLHRAASKVREEPLDCRRSNVGPHFEPAACEHMADPGLDQIPVVVRAPLIAQCRVEVVQVTRERLCRFDGALPRAGFGLRGG